MNQFVLDAQLKKDCIVLGKLGSSSLLMMNNSLVPWFILVPHTSKIEFTDLPKLEQMELLEEIDLLSSFIKNNFNITKLNTAAIGNIVSQLHIHVVGRNPADYCWPNVVWGTKEREAYNAERINEIVKSLHEQLSDKYTE